MLSHSNWAGLGVKNIYSCIKKTVDKTHFLIKLFRNGVHKILQF
jgi:hypothetical protein